LPMVLADRGIDARVSRAAAVHREPYLPILLQLGFN
jgi:hypothetical protein